MCWGNASTGLHLVCHIVLSSPSIAKSAIPSDPILGCSLLAVALICSWGITVVSTILWAPSLIVISSMLPLKELVELPILSKGKINVPTLPPLLLFIVSINSPFT